MKPAVHGVGTTVKQLSIFLAMIKKNTAWNVYIKLVARLNGGKFEMCKISEVPTSSAFSKTAASKMPVMHCKGK